ncbi:phosphotransferase [Novosphingobium sp. CCH12-A3]|uniref:phosphotransferase n=1 Tax=Novosphingobium sp. CCH12-A3 TaxID=1768752 RepID=UPI0007816A48|nr:phosphotransferase [Novosphingobium sp. CCH12-A3]
MIPEADDFSPDEIKIRAWLVEAIGGSITTFERLPRWRPSWRVTVERDGEAIELHVRSDRPSGLGIRPLRREYEVLKLFEQNNIPVPQVHGWIADPEAIVMAHMSDTPFLGDVDCDPAVQRMVEEYAGHLAAVHALDTAPFIEAGLPAGTDAQAVALDYLLLAESQYEVEDRPDALLRFVTGWLRRHLPLHRNQNVVLIGDAPQFFHNRERVTAFYDLELAKLGDPIADLASIRVRDINEPISDVAAVLSRYVKDSGSEIDWPVLTYYTVLLFIAVPMMTKATFRKVSPHPAYVEYLSWGMGATRAALEAIAEGKGYALDPVEAITCAPLRDAFAWRDLALQCGALPPEGFFRQPPAQSLAFYLQRLAESGDDIERAELEDARSILGIADPAAETLETQLDAFVEQARPEHDRALVRYFHRRQMRRLQLLRDYPGPIVTRGLAPLDHLFPDAYPRPATN